MQQEFKGKTCIVTGSASGIGQAAAIVLAERGASIVLLDVDKKRLEITKKTIENIGVGVLALPIDVSNAAEVEAATQKARDEFGQINFLVNSAGIAGSINDGLTADLDLKRWHSIIDINLNGSFYAAKYCLPYMLEAGGGVIIFISSVMGAMGAPGIGAYVASKHAVAGLAKSIAAEYGANNIRSLAIAPGYIETPMTADLAQHGISEDTPMISTPMRRPGKPEEVAKFIAALLSDDASYVTGGFYPIDGGFLATK